MKDFIDRTSGKSGTPINRANLMAAQGFVSSSAVFDRNGNCVQTNAFGETLEIVFNPDGTITETFTGEKIINKTISFDENGNLKEVIS